MRGGLIACLLLSGCLSPREEFLQEVKEGVDGRMEYRNFKKPVWEGLYLGGPSHTGNCVDYAYTYAQDAKAKGVGGMLVTCTLGPDKYHAAFRTTDGYVLDNRHLFVYQANTCER